MKCLSRIFTVLSLIMFAQISYADISAPLGQLAIQEGGRVKPLDTFARESLELIYGKQKYSKRSGLEIVMSMLLQPASWDEEEIFEIKHPEVKRALRFPENRRYFRLAEITSNDRLSTLIQELQTKRDAKEKLTPYYQAIQRIESQVVTYREIVAGRALRLLPPQEGDQWISLSDFTDEAQMQFQPVITNFIATLGFIADPDRSSKKAEGKRLEQELEKSVAQFTQYAASVNPEKFPVLNKIKAEVHYNHFHPFKFAWILYVLSALAALLSWVGNRNGFYTASWVFAWLGFVFLNYGFLLRVYLTERAPVTNMYETVVWVAWGTFVFAAIFELIYKWRFILFAGTMVAAFCLVLGDMAPAVLDASLQPLEPVLRSNFWLLIHVLIITISYSAFFLAMGLGDVGLVYVLLGEEKHKEKIKAIVLATYRSMQVGIAFLAPGIILGGIWADYSWGRFWGWDPKETWALIALLGYLAVLHARLVGMVKDFGMLVSGVVTFSLVIMAWYGVNFVLGAGLHSYGFGAGGVEYVAGFVALHILFCFFVGYVRWQRQKQR